MVKGFMKTLEASITVVIIMASLFLLLPSKTATESLHSVAENCIQQLESKNLVSYYASSNDENGLRTELTKCIPQALDFQVKICSTADCSAQLPEKSISAANYISSGYTSFKPRLVNVWVWYK